MTESGSTLGSRVSEFNPSQLFRTSSIASVGATPGPPLVRPAPSSLSSHVTCPLSCVTCTPYMMTTQHRSGPPILSTTPPATLPAPLCQNIRTSLSHSRRNHFLHIASANPHPNRAMRPPRAKASRDVLEMFRDLS